MFRVVVEEKHAAVLGFFFWLKASSALRILAHCLIWASVTLIAAAGGCQWDLTAPVLNNQQRGNKKKTAFAYRRVNGANAVNMLAEVERLAEKLDFMPSGGKPEGLGGDF